MLAGVAARSRQLGVTTGIQCRANEQRKPDDIRQNRHRKGDGIPLLIDKIGKAPRVVVATLRMCYVRIEAGRAGRRICSEPAYNYGKRTKTTDARAKGLHAEGGQARTKPPMSEPQTEAGNQIAL